MKGDINREGIFVMLNVLYVCWLKYDEIIFF